MDPWITIASLSIKAVNTYFVKKKEEQLQEIINQNEKLIAFTIQQHIEQKRMLVYQANLLLADAQYSSSESNRQNLIDKEQIIETTFSQFTDQFMMIRSYAKQDNGLFARVIGKISAFTFLQYINYINNKPIGRVKYALI